MITSKAAGIALVSGGRVLLLHRPDGTWGYPAGKVEDGELIVNAAIRETFEETGYVVTGQPRLMYTKESPPGSGVSFTLFSAAVLPFNVILNDEHDGFLWCPMDSMPGNCIEGMQDDFNASFAMDRSDTAREYDLNGWYEVEGNPISRVGVFPYLGKNIKGAPDPGAFYNVYRPASELSDPECIASFRLVPWIDDHAMLGKGDMLTLPEDKGIHGVIGERVYFDESDQTLKGNIKVFTSSHADTIDAGKRELSAGYRCIYTKESGEFDGVRYDYVQRKMRGNHLASVKDGRMGPDISVMDAKEAFSFTIDSREFKSMVTKTNGPKAKPKAKPVNKVTSLFGQLMAYATDAAEEGEEKDAGEMAELAALLEQAEPLIEQIASIGAVQSGAATPDDDVTDVTRVPATDALPVGTSKATDAEEDKDKDKDKDKGAVAMDASEVKKIVAAAVAEALAGVSHGMDAKEVFREVKNRDALAEDLSFHVGTFDHSEMTHEEVAAYGVKKLGLPGVPKGQEVGAVSAYLHGRQRPRAPVAQHAMDAADKSGSFVSNYLNGKE